MAKSPREKKPDTSAPDPTKALQSMYEKFWKQTAQQWDEVARSPEALAIMAANLNQSLELKSRVQESVVALLRTMNIPSRDDLAAVSIRLDEIAAQIADIDKKAGSRTAARTSSSNAKITGSKKAGKRAGKKA